MSDLKNKEITITGNATLDYTKDVSKQLLDLIEQGKASMKETEGTNVINVKNGGKLIETYGNVSQHFIKNLKVSDGGYVKQTFKL